MTSKPSPIRSAWIAPIIGTMVQSKVGGASVVARRETCRLCLQERPLRDSHIIPEFLYRPLVDEKHRAAALDQGVAKLRYT